MKAPIKWLKKYTDIDVSPEEFTRKMVMAGFEIEGVEEPGAGIRNVVVGRILKLEKHPNADKLQICQIDVGGSRTLQIVTGATNVFEGALVPVAVDGSDLPGGVRIKTSKLRGVESSGMLCSGEELRVDDAFYPGASEHGILIFHEEHPLGSDVRPILGIDEPVVDFKITANRAADCMCMLGLAREAAVALRKEMREPAITYAENGGNIVDYLKVTVLDYKLCPRYTARVIRNVKIAESPLWMRQALAASGVRPINNIVDITNYVMLETGQPMHAFDRRFIRGGEIIVRRAQPGEKLLTLDEKERTLSDSMLVIADAEGPVGLAGIMGGEHSGIYPDTETVVFELANFEWKQIRVTSRALGMRTESSSRYEKGLPAWLPELAMQRAMTLITELGAGEIVAGAVDCREVAPEKRQLEVSVSRICRYLGQPIEADAMKDILHRLGFDVSIDGDTLKAIVPPWRQDVEGWADIAEEVQRVYGYESIPSIAPPGEALQGRRTQRQLDKLKILNLLAGLGLNEAMAYSFYSPKVFDLLGLPQGDELRSAVRLLNPIGEDYSLMRTTLAPSMLRSIATNRSRKASAVRLFEISRVFRPDPQASLRDAQGNVTLSKPCYEKEMLCIGISDDAIGFFGLKGMLETFFGRFGIAGVEYKPGSPCYYHPGRSAEAWVGETRLAVLGEAHPDVCAAFEAGERALLAEVDVDALFALARRDSAIKPLPKYPAISRDLAVSVDKLAPAGGMLSSIRKSGGNLLESVEIFDIYEGKQAGEGKKSVAFSLVFRSGDHTLVDEEANACFDSVVAALNRDFNAEIRR